MSEPLNKVQVFCLIYQSALDTGAGLKAHDEYDAFIERGLEKYRRAHSCMKEVTVQDYHNFFLIHWSENSILRRLELEKAKRTPEQFWKAAYDLGSLGSPDVNTDLDKMRFYNLGVYVLGKLRGSATLGLSAGMLAVDLPTTDQSTFNNMGNASTCFRSISYSDGHPSEPSFKVRASEDSTLRRFVCLGWVLHQSSTGWWNDTGHVLVVDMDHGRDRHPWFVLSSKVPSYEEQEDGDFFIHVPARLSFSNDFFDYQISDMGILLGDRERTPVGRIEPKDPSNPVPVLQQFGPDFEFDIARFGGESAREVDDDRYGPDLAHIMDWYWDPEKEEFCCYKNGQEYLRYNDHKVRNTYANTERLDHKVNDEKSIFASTTVSPVGRPAAESDHLASECLNNRPRTLESQLGQVKREKV